MLAWAAERGGVFARADALELFAAHVVDDALTSGAIVRLLPSTYALPEFAGDRSAHRRAALLHRPDAALGGLDALDVWVVLDEPQARGAIELVTEATRRESKAAGLRVARRAGFRNAPPHVVVRDGMRVTRLERTIVDSWPLLPEMDRRAPALIAVRERRTTGDRLLDALAASGRVHGAAQMRHAFGLIARGCHSPLELWGHENVFNVGALRHAQCQVRMQTPSGVIYVDRFYAAEMVAVEMDGAAYHGAPGQRERDIRRDATLAALGIQTIRFSHPRLFGDAPGARSDLLHVLAVRRDQLGRRSA
jgi:very-short-patch-repair endonuclease